MNPDRQEPRTAEHWVDRGSGSVECRLCPHHCRLGEGRTGCCRVRTVRGGRLVADGYGIISSAHVDPVEKKPLYHFHPGEPIFSMGGWGCNLGCVFCQNWTISQQGAGQGPRHAPGEMIDVARREGCRMIAYTYNEPLVGFEFVRDCSVLARQAGMKNVLVTNGYIDEAPAAELLPVIDALNVDIKSMDDAFYRKQCKGELQPVLRFCVQAVKAGCHVEITNLIIPTLNDTDEQVARLATWIRESLGQGVPLHLSAYHPDYRAQWDPTPASTLMRAWEVSRRDLTYVYVGNVMTRQGQDTRCPGCGHELIRRRGYAVTLTGLDDGKCARCGRPADLVLG